MPEARRSGAGNSRDGAAVAVALDGDGLRLGGGERDVACFAITRLGEKAALVAFARFSPGGHRSGDAVGEALDLAVAQRGDGDGGFSAVDRDGFERGFAREYGGDGAREARWAGRYASVREIHVLL